MANYLKIPEVARRLDVSEKTARRYIKAGALPSTFIGGAYRVTEEGLERFLTQAEVKPEDASPKVGSSLLDPSVFDGLEGEWLYKLEAAEHAIRYIIGRAEYWEQELEREDKTADSAYDLAVRAIDEFSDFNRHFFDVVAYEIGREIENGNAPELVDAYFSLEETFIERISRTQRLLLDYAKGLAKTEDQRDDLVRRREIANDNVNRERRSA